MKKIYEKTTRELMRDYAKTIQADQKIKREKIRNWFKDNYPKIKIGTIDAHITRMTTNAPSRAYYNAASDGSDNIFFQMPDGYLRLYDEIRDPNPLYSKIDTETQEKIEEAESASRLLKNS